GIADLCPLTGDQWTYHACRRASRVKAELSIAVTHAEEVAMKQSLRLGRIAGIPVGVNWSVLVILVLIADIVARTVLPRADAGRSASVYWAIAIPTAVLFLASLLAHEGAHAAIARRKGLGVRSITLWMLGGVAQLDGEPQNARADFAIAAAGPLTS